MYLCEHFFPQPFGEIHMIQLKKRPGSGESKGFGFIRFVDKEVEKKVRSFFLSFFIQGIKEP